MHLKELCPAYLFFILTNYASAVHHICCLHCAVCKDSPVHPLLTLDSMQVQTSTLFTWGSLQTHVGYTWHPKWAIKVWQSFINFFTDVHVDTFIHVDVLICEMGFDSRWKQWSQTERNRLVSVSVIVCIHCIVYFCCFLSFHHTIGLLSETVVNK